jgi:hypothetical protein
MKKIFIQEFLAVKRQETTAFEVVFIKGKYFGILEQHLTFQVKWSDVLFNSLVPKVNFSECTL